MSFQNTLARHNQLFQALGALEPVVGQLADQIERTIRQGGKILFFGNGGSAADSQHLAAEFVVRYKTDRKAIAALALTVDTSILTAGANDYGFSSVYARQIEALCRKEDIVIGISTSGDSDSIVQGIRAAQEIGAAAWAWTGESGGKLKDIARQIIRVPSAETARVQEAHIFIGHWLCEEIDRRFAKG